MNDERVMKLRGHSCTIAPVLDGPNVKSDSSSSYCQNKFWGDSDLNEYPADKMRFYASNPEKDKGYVSQTLYGEGQLFHLDHAGYIPLQSDRFITVGLSVNATTFVRNLLRNIEILCNVTGVALTEIPLEYGDGLLFT